MIRPEAPRQTWEFTITGEAKMPVFHQTGFPSLMAANHVGMTVMRSVYPGHRLHVKRETT